MLQPIYQLLHIRRIHLLIRHQLIYLNRLHSGYSLYLQQLYLDYLYLLLSEAHVHLLWKRRNQSYQWKKCLLLQERIRHLLMISTFRRSLKPEKRLRSLLMKIQRQLHFCFVTGLTKTGTNEYVVI